MSLGSVRAGPRLDELLADDPVGQQENQTAAGRAKALETYRMVVDPMVVPTGSRWFLGTRWHEDDIYASLIRAGWPTLVRQAIQEDGTALWPAYWSLAKLAAQREELGSAVFDLQYQNDPSGMGGNIFRREWFQYVDRLPARVSRRAGVDLAASASERSDYTALGEIVEDDDHNLYVVGSYADRLDEGHRAWLTGLRDGEFVTVGAASPRLLWPGRLLPAGFAGFDGASDAPRVLTSLNVESTAYQNTFTPDLLRNTRLPARAVHPDRDKVTRARTLAARYEAGKVFHLRGAPGARCVRTRAHRVSERANTTTGSTRWSTPPTSAGTTSTSPRPVGRTARADRGRRSRLPGRDARKAAKSATSARSAAVKWSPDARARVADAESREFVRESTGVDAPEPLEKLDERDPGRVRRPQQVGGRRTGPRRAGRIEERRDVAGVAAHCRTQLPHREAGAVDDVAQGRPERLIVALHASRLLRRSRTRVVSPVD